MNEIIKHILHQIDIRSNYEGQRLPYFQDLKVTIDNLSIDERLVLCSIISDDKEHDGAKLQLLHELGLISIGMHLANIEGDKLKILPICDELIEGFPELFAEAVTCAKDWNFPK